MKKPFEPNFRTPKDEQSGVESIKANSLFVHREIAAQFSEHHITNVTNDVEQCAKSFGIYLEFDRAKTGRERDWMYMIRIAIPGGGPLTREQWQLFEELSEKYCVDPQGNTSLRFTTRQTVQLHWVKKEGLKPIIKAMAEKGLNSLNGCGDNTRNVMSCPLTKYSDIFNANKWAHKVGEYFQLPLEPFIKIFAIDPNYLRKPGESFQYGPQLLNRKFKIAFSTYHRDADSGLLVPDNCIELRTNDLGVAPILENDKVTAFQLYVGGGQGERNGQPTTAALSEPLCIVTEDKLLKVMDAVVQVHQEWGDRENRHWARLKYVIKKMGVEWFRDQVTAKLGFALEKPNLEHDIGARHLHFGWHQQPNNKLWSYGLYIENGRLTDNSPNGKLKSMVKDVMNKFPFELSITANQDIIFSNIEENQKDEFEAFIKSYGYGERNGKPYSSLRQRSGACVGRDTCRLTYTDSEKFEPELLDQLEELGWGDMKESIGITGCERQCFRPATKSIGLVGTGLNRYMFKFFGDEEARHQGRPLIPSDNSGIYLRFVLREQVAIVIDALFKKYKESAQSDESLGAFHRRIGADAIIQNLKENPQTAEFMEKPFTTDYVLD